MTAERRQGLLEALFVADVRPNLAERTEANLARGQHQSGLRHRDEEADRLDRDGLAACVRAGDQHAIEILADVERERHGDLGIEEGVPSLVDEDAMPLRLDRCNRVHRVAQSRLGEDQIDGAGGLDASGDAGRLMTDPATQVGEDPRDLGPFGGLGLAGRVAELDDLLRFDEDRLAAGARIVDDALDLAAILGFEGDDVSAIALGEHPVAQQITGLAGGVSLDSVRNALGAGRSRPAQPPEFGTRGVEDLAVRFDAVQDLLLQGPEVGEGFGADPQLRPSAAAGLDDRS